MRKILIGTLVSSCMLFASDKAVELKSNLFDLNKVKSEEMRDFLVVFESTLPSTTKVVKDYYEVKTCNKEFYNEITIDNIKEFVSTSPVFSALISLNTLNSDKKEDAKDNGYSELINTYKFINCGKGTLPNPINMDLKKWKMENESVSIILFVLGVFFLGLLLGKKVGRNESFGISGTEDGINYSFSSEKNFDDTLKKIGALVKENTMLKNDKNQQSNPL